MTRKLRILLVQGHRNTGGGNNDEIAQTPRAARAIQHALRAGGHTADMLQNDDDWFPGSLDAVGREVVRRHDKNPYDIMLDIHFEGDSANTPGVFAIVPDGDGLRTMTSYKGTDSMTSNTLDVRYGEAIATSVARHTGLKLRKSGTVRPGLMSEKQTGVGGLGYRLAMFGYTSPVRHRLVRLVLELGNIRADAKIISSAGFHERVGQGVLAGIEQVLASDSVIEFAKPIPADMPPFGTITPLRTSLLVNVTVPALNARQWAETDQRIMRVLGTGNSFWARAWIVGETVDANPIWWIMGRGAKTDLLWRVWSGGTDRTMSEIMALPRKEAA